MKEILHFWELSDGFRIDLRSEFKRELLETCRQLCGSFKKLEKITNIPWYSFSDFKKGQSKTVSFVVKLVKFLQKNNVKISLDEVEKNIKLLRYGFRSNPIYNPGLPFNLTSKEGLRVISASLHDGSIKKDLSLTYTNTKEILHSQVKNSVNKVFGSCSCNRTNYITQFSTAIGAILVKFIGMKCGRKVVVNPRVPTFIFNCSKEAIGKGFLQQAFDDEACVSTRRIILSLSIDALNIPKDDFMKLKNWKNLPKGEKNILAENFAPQLLKDDKKLLEKLGINVIGPSLNKIYYTRKNQIRTAWKIEINGQTNLKNFNELVGFSLPTKNQKLNIVLSSYKIPYFKRGTQKIEVLKTMEKICSSKGFITASLISKEIKRNKKHVCDILTKLKRENLIKILSYPTNIRDTTTGRFTTHIPTKYTLTDYGINLLKNYPSIGNNNTFR